MTISLIYFVDPSVIRNLLKSIRCVTVSVQVIKKIKIKLPTLIKITSKVN